MSALRQAEAERDLARAEVAELRDMVRHLRETCAAHEEALAAGRADRNALRVEIDRLQRNPKGDPDAVPR